MQLAVLPDDDFAIQHRAIRNICRKRGEFRETIRHQFLAAGPDPQLALACHQLRADTVPFPFDLPVAGRADLCGEIRRGNLQGMREEEWIGLAHVALVFTAVGDGRDQALKTRVGRSRRQIGVANQPLGNALRIDVHERRQRARDEQLGNAHAKTAGDEFDAHQLAAAIQLLEQGQQARDHFL